MELTRAQYACPQCRTALPERRRGPYWPGDTVVCRQCAAVVRFQSTGERLGNAPRLRILTESEVREWRETRQRIEALASLPTIAAETDR